MKYFNNKSDIQWSKTKIGILGGGRSGIAAAKLGKYLGANIFISDSDNRLETIEKMHPFDYESGVHSKKILDSDLVIISPGITDSIPIIYDCKCKNIPIVSEIEFASWFTPSPILALTGSNGKTTTVNLLHNMCISDGKNSFLGGNVGIPFSENVLWELKSEMINVVHVLELSSFQLEHIQSFSPAIAGLLNISEDHLDRYKDINDYLSKKINITKNISGSGCVIYNGDDPMLVNAFQNHKHAQIFSVQEHQKSHFKLNASKVYSGPNAKPDILFKLDETELKGIHNLQNILAAATMANAFGITSKAIRDSITNFTPIPHRLEWIGKLNGVDYFNDSKATNLAAAHAAIKSFDNQLILIMGGKDKGHTDFSQLSPLLINRVKHIFTYGLAGETIEKQINSTVKVTYVEEFSSAVIQASKQSQSGDIILLSPACTSFDQFCNYEERGAAFKNIFKNLELGL